MLGHFITHFLRTEGIMMRKFSFVFCILSLVLFSCSTKGTNWDVDVMAPVVETKLDLTNLIGSNNLSIAQDSAVSIAVDVPLYTFSFDTLSNLSASKNIYSFVWAGPTITVPGGTTLLGQTSDLDLNSGDIKLSRFDVKKGKLRCTLKSTLSQRLIFRYYIPNATKGGVMLEFVDTLAGAITSSDTVIFVREFIIDDFQFNLTGANGDDFNSLTAYLDVSTIVGDPGTLMTNGQTLYKTETELIEITPDYAKGYLGQYNFNSTNAVTNFSELQMVQSGLIDIENINLNLVFHNRIGADISFNPTEIKATNTRTGQVVILTHSSIGTSININRAIENLNPLNPVTESNNTINITSVNSNIEQFIELIPDQLSLLSDVRFNAYGNTSGYADFFYYDFSTYIQLQLNMPLKFSATDLLLIDTIDNPFFNLGSLDPIHDGEFIVRVENKFPLESDLQLYLLDQAGTITDSIFANTIIAAAPVDANDRVIQSISTDLIMSASAANIQKLKSAVKIQIKANFNTIPVSSGRLQFYSDYYMLIRMIADVKFNIAI